MIRCETTTWRGRTVCVHSLPKLKKFAASTGDAILIELCQGCYSTSVEASKGTHAGGGVYDVEMDGYTLTQANFCVNKARAALLAAFGRWWNGNWHIHMIDPDCPNLAAPAEEQMEQFRNGETGLIGHTDADQWSRTYAAAILAAYDKRGESVDAPYTYDYITKYTSNADNWMGGRDGNKVSGITIHHWGSSSKLDFLGIVTFLCSYRPSNPTSAHYVAQGRDQYGKASRKVACIVDPDDTAYHAGNWQANLTNIGIECRPYPTADDYDVISELVARLWMTYGKVPLYPHKHWTSTECPGKYDVNKIYLLAEPKYAALKAGLPLPTSTDKVVNLTPYELFCGSAILKNTLASNPDTAPRVAPSFLIEHTAAATAANAASLAALTAAVKALAASHSLDGDALVAAVQTAVNEALAGLSVTLTAQPVGGAA